MGTPKVLFFPLLPPGLKWPQPSSGRWEVGRVENRNRTWRPALTHNGVVVGELAQSQTNVAFISSLPFPSSVDLDKSFLFPELWFPHLWNRDVTSVLLGCVIRAKRTWQGLPPSE